MVNRGGCRNPKVKTGTPKTPAQDNRDIRCSNRRNLLLKNRPVLRIGLAGALASQPQQFWRHHEVLKEGDEKLSGDADTGRDLYHVWLSLHVLCVRCVHHSDFHHACTVSRSLV